MPLADISNWYKRTKTSARCAICYRCMNAERRGHTALWCYGYNRLYEMSKTATVDSDWTKICPYYCAYPNQNAL